MTTQNEQYQNGDAVYVDRAAFVATSLPTGERVPCIVHHVNRLGQVYVFKARPTGTRGATTDPAGLYVDPRFVTAAR